MLALSDHSGLICGYAIYPGRTQPVGWDDMDQALKAHSGVVWLHLNLADRRARDWLETCSHLPPRARELLLADDRHLRLDPLGDGVVGIVGDFHHDLHTPADEVGVLHFYVDDHCLVSARRMPLKAVDQLRHAVGDGLRVNHPFDLVIELFHYVGTALEQAVERLADQLDDIEDPILAGRIADKGGELGRARRLGARMRRHLMPQKHALVALLSRLPDWLGENQAARMRRAVERLDVLAHDLDIVQERARLLQDELSTRLAEETNRNLYILSIVTVIFLPMTLISGIFGMNLGGLPGAQDGYGFWWGMALMIGVAAATAYALKRLRLL